VNGRVVPYHVSAVTVRDSERRTAWKVTNGARKRREARATVFPGVAW